MVERVFIVECKAGGTYRVYVETIHPVAVLIIQDKVLVNERPRI